MPLHLFYADGSFTSWSFKNDVILVQITNFPLLQTKSKLAKSRQPSQDAPTAQPHPASSQESVDKDSSLREGARQDCPLPGGEQQVI